MRKLVLVLLVMACCVVLGAGNALALLGTNITIFDNRPGNGGVGVGLEDQETEPGMINNQSWDLEGFFMQGSTLAMVGGWDFVNGAPAYSYESGDIFIDISGDAQYGSDQDRGVLNYGYDYVLDLDFSNFTYNVYALSVNSILLGVAEYYNAPESDPWRYGGGDTVLDGYQGLGFGYTDYGILTDDETGFEGDTHNAVAVDLSFLGKGQDFIAHFTIGCGNDNLMGRGTTPAPEPATMLLLGSGLIGLACVGRRKFRAGKIAK